MNTTARLSPVTYSPRATWPGPLPLPRAALLAAIFAASSANCGGRTDHRPDAGLPPGPSRGINVTTGALPLYHIYQGKPRNDASGVVFLPDQKRILVVDDGGEDRAPENVPFFMVDVGALFGPMPMVTSLPAPVDDLVTSVAGRHLDVEAVTFDGKYVYVASSLPGATEPGKEKPAYRALSRVKVVAGGIADATTVDPREGIIEALRTWAVTSGDPSWFDRVSRLAQKSGGLNLEAMSYTPVPDELLLGLRSPHAGADYLAPGDAGVTRSGRAILVKIKVGAFPDGLSPSVHATLDLGGLGFRSLEYSPTAKGYFLTAGAVEAGWDYDLYFWNGQPESPPVSLKGKIKEFDKLCRPEGVTEIERDGRRYLMVLSEDSGDLCEQPPVPFNYLLVELNSDFLDLLR